MSTPPSITTSITTSTTTPLSLHITTTSNLNLRLTSLATSVENSHSTNYSTTALPLSTAAAGPPPSYTRSENPQNSPTKSAWAGPKMNRCEQYNREGPNGVNLDDGVGGGILCGNVRPMGSSVELGMQQQEGEDGGREVVGGKTGLSQKGWRPKVWWRNYGRYKMLKKEIKEAEREVEIWRGRYDGGFV